MTDDPAIIEAVRALQAESDYVLSNDTAERIASAVLAAVTPLIRAAALEEAAQVADKFTCGLCGMDDSAARAIRALKEQP